MNEPDSTPDALDLCIEQALARRFDPPASLDTLAAHMLPRRRLRVGPWLAAAAVAAFVGARFLLDGEPRERSDGPVTDGVAVAPQDPSAPDAPFCRMIGPLVEGQPEPGWVHSPDLVRLYREMDACQRESSSACGAGDFLAERLSETYGQPLALRPEAAGRLHGPFGSDEWPTGTIVTGTSEERTTVLVADRGETLDCCLRMRLSQGSGLKLFTWQVGDVVLTEITPLEEPRLLAYFE
jgi:hypothetical protein